MDMELLARNFYDYSIHMRGYSQATLRRYKNVIDFYRRFANIQNIEEVNENNLRELFIHGRTIRKWRPNTFIGYHKSLGVFFRWCRTNRYMTEDPLRDIELPKVEKRLPSKFTNQEAQKILEIVYNLPYDHKFLRYRNHAIFSTFLFAGLRKSELLNLRYTDVDVENMTIFVNQGKGNKDRIIPITFTLAVTLKRYLEERNRLHKTCPQFFTSYNRNMGFTKAGLRRIVARIQSATTLKFGVHKLRHTFATLMLEGGCDIYSLSKMMGHSDIKTTTLYLSASAEHLRQQVGKHPLNNVIRL